MLFREFSKILEEERRSLVKPKKALAVDVGTGRCLVHLYTQTIIPAVSGNDVDDCTSGAGLDPQTSHSALRPLHPLAPSWLSGR